jgi:DNA-binding IclR family transcriptional regulator
MSQHYLPATTLALEIGLFELLGRQPTGISAADIASGLGLGSRSVDALLAVLCGLKLVAQSGGVFTLTPLATTYMLADSQYYWGHMLLGDRSEMHARLKKVRNRQDRAGLLFSVVVDSDAVSLLACLQCVESDKPVGAAAEWESGELTEDRARVRPPWFGNHQFSFGSLCLTAVFARST